MPKRFSIVNGYIHAVFPDGSIQPIKVIEKQAVIKILDNQGADMALANKNSLEFSSKPDCSGCSSLPDRAGYT